MYLFFLSYGNSTSLCSFTDIVAKPLYPKKRYQDPETPPRTAVAHQRLLGVTQSFVAFTVITLKPFLDRETQHSSGFMFRPGFNRQLSSPAEWKSSS